MDTTMSNYKKIRYFMLSHTKLLSKVMRFFVKKAGALSIALISAVNRIFPLLAEAAGDDDKGLIRRMLDKIKTIVIKLTAPLFRNVFVASKKLVQSIDSKEGGNVIKGLLLLYATWLAETVLDRIIGDLVVKFVKRKQEKNNMEFAEVIRQVRFLSDFISVIIFAPILEEAARKISINASDKKSFVYTLAIMILEAAGKSNRLMSVANRKENPKKFIATRLPTILVTRLVHMIYHKLHLTSDRFGTILAMIIHAFFNGFVIYLSHNRRK